MTITKRPDFCKVYTSYYGEPIDKAEQLSMIRLSGPELEEFCDFYFLSVYPTEQSVLIERRDTLIYRLKCLLFVAAVVIGFLIISNL